MSEAGGCGQLSHWEVACYCACMRGDRQELSLCCLCPVLPSPLLLLLVFALASVILHSTLLSLLLSILLFLLFCFRFC